MIGSCSNNPDDYFLGGECKLSHHKISKYYPLPPHSFVKIELNLHILDEW